MRAMRILLPLLLAVSFSTASLAHEGHLEDMSDEEMAAAQMGQADIGMAGMPSSHENRGEVCMAQCLDEEPGRDDGHEGHWMSLPETEALPDNAVVGEASPLELAIERNRATSAGDFLGRLHPIAAHFPIALLLIAALAELMLMLRPTFGLQPTIRFLIIGGAIGALIAAPLGWSGAGWRLLDRSETLFQHRWLGTGIALASLLAAWLVTRKGESRTALRLVLAALAMALIAQGYLGGEMVFGPNHLGVG